MTIAIEVIRSTEIINFVRLGDLILCQSIGPLNALCSKLVSSGIKAQVQATSPIALELLNQNTASRADNVFLIGCNTVPDELASIAVGCAIKKLYCVPFGIDPAQTARLLEEPYGGMVVVASAPTEPAYPIGTTFSWFGRSGFVVTSVRRGAAIDHSQWMYGAKFVKQGIHWELKEYPHHLMTNVEIPSPIAA